MEDSSIDQKTLLREKEENIERLETRVVSLKEEAERMKKQLRTNERFNKSIGFLHDILVQQRLSFDKWGIIFGITQEVGGKLSRLPKKKNEKKSWSHRGSRERNHDQQGPRTIDPIRRPTLPKYQNIFLGVYYSCNTFG